MNILSLLIEKGLIKAEDVAAIQAEAEQKKLPLESVLESKGVTRDVQLSTASEHYGIPSRVLPQNKDIEQAALEFIPQESAEHYRFVPLGIVDGALEVGITDPDNIEARDALQFISTRAGMPYKLFLISENDFSHVIEEYQNLSGVVGEALSEFEGSAAESEESKKMEAEVESAAIGAPAAVGADGKIKADSPVTKIVATALRYAVEGGASDIHIEPSPGKTRVRFRMDGELHTSLELPAKVHAAVVARIKIMAQLRLDEKRKPQDGRFSSKVDNRLIDFRVSTFPTQHGEKVVMRILDRTRSVANIEAIGFTEDQLAMVKEILKVPYGIVLICGPTGSGKSTTLFGMLSEIDSEKQNVVSIEDPVEYEIPGIAQSQVHPEIGYDFANGLRSILRQDPDVIMVGEIRDKETAQLAIQAALTGHLVFSTIHTNNTAGVIPRLIDMGVDPYLIAPTLVAAIGQRLVRKLCPGAGQKIAVTDSIKGLLEREFADLPPDAMKRIPAFESMYRAQATPDCPNGTRGRIGVFEFMRMDKDLEHTVLTNPVEEAVYAVARKKGMFTMREDAIMKALAGEIPFEEVNTLGGELFPEEEESI
ncbi:MAG: GspE/PulE family protein [Patescibacteria group bacterium]